MTAAGGTTVPWTGQLTGPDGTGSDNLFYTGNPGQLFNQGSGLGLPNMSQLAADFAG